MDSSVSEATPPAFSMSLVDAATDAIRDRIIDLSLAPGKSVNTKWLVSNLKLSRTPIREALNRLAAEGLIRFENNQGVYVQPLDVGEINQLMDAYRVAERISAFHCDFTDPDLLHDVTALQARQRDAVRAHKYLEASYCNARFRTRIAETSHNHHLLEFHRRMINHTRRLSCLIYSMEAREAVYYTGQLEMLKGLHNDIAKAIAAADRDRLVEVHTEQVDVFRSRIAKVLERRRAGEFPLG